MSEHRKLTIGVGVAIVGTNRKILIGKRGLACKRGPGMWALPGGMVNSDEDIATCIVREIHEETGLFVEPFGTHGEKPFSTTTPFAVTDHLGEENHISLWYTAWIKVTSTPAILVYNDPPVKEPGKCECWKWLSLDEIAQLPGVNIPGSEQYYWIPLDMWLRTIPTCIFGKVNG